MAGREISRRKVIKLEYKDEKGVPAYEFEILDQAGKTWELECDANKGKITEEEQEVENGDGPLFKFKSKAKIIPAAPVASSTGRGRGGKSSAWP